VDRADEGDRHGQGTHCFSTGENEPKKGDGDASNRSEREFTLVELLVVITVMAF
jgi:hypothetical protein